MANAPVLVALRIEDLAIVDRVELSFGPGLNVLTGETGAGKSILVGAMNLLLGGRAASDLVRAGAKEAVVEAFLDLEGQPERAAAFAARGIDVSDGEVVVRRTMAASGRGRVTINGQLATVGMLAEAMRGLIDVSGQHEHVSLLDADRHVDRVDAFGGLFGLRSKVAEAHADVVGLETALDALQMDESEKARREDFIRFQLDEIERVDPKPGELEALEVERRRLRNATALSDGARRAEDALYSADGAVVETVGRIQHQLVELSRLDDRLAGLSSSAAGALAELEELARALGRYVDSIDADPERLDALEDRLDTLQRLVRKHGGSVERVLEVREALADELDGLVHDEARRADLQSALEAAEAKLAARAVELSAARAKAAKALERAVQAELGSLSMGNTQLEIQLLPLDRIGPRGAERAEIRIAPNPGEPSRPLHKTASGGELSRVLLAVKGVLARTDDVAAYVFDEVDTGIGGAVADVIGQKLHAVSAERQLVVITHLPQVAAWADTHLQVHKRVEGERTVSRVSKLDEAEIIEELARMLGGVEITDRTRRLAEEMWAKARARRKAAGAAVSSATSEARRGRASRRGT
jgi:DNA repair protein RecN (Recombination protein N)